MLPISPHASESIEEIENVSREKTAEPLPLHIWPARGMGVDWTEDEFGRLIELLATGMGQAEAGAVIGRSHAAVRLKLYRARNHRSKLGDLSKI